MNNMYEKKYNPTEFTSDYYYFYDINNKVFAVSKSISYKDYFILKETYFEKTFHFCNERTKAFYEFLFENKELKIKEKGFKFIVINILEDKDQNMDNLLELLRELFANSIILNLNNTYTLFYFDDVDFSIDSLFMSIIDDFSVKLKVFSSSKMNIKRDYFFNIYYSYRKYLKNKPYLFSSICELILEIMKIDFSQIKNISKCILSRILEDVQVEHIINAMFENNLNVTKTAQQVYMHRNTIINKLDYIKKESNLNIQNFKDAMAMYSLLRSK